MFKVRIVTIRTEDALREMRHGIAVVAFFNKCGRGSPMPDGAYHVLANTKPSDCVGVSKYAFASHSRLISSHSVVRLPQPQLP
jgi:hypothetical protein